MLPQAGVEEHNREVELKARSVRLSAKIRKEKKQTKEPAVEKKRGHGSKISAGRFKATCEGLNREGKKGVSALLKVFCLNQVYE